MKVTLITGRTLGQGQGKEIGKTSEKYKQSVAICEIDPEDLEEFNIQLGTNVRVSTEFGSVIVRGVKSIQAPHRGIVFIPCGPWASAIMDSRTHGTGMPSMKGLQAEVEVAPDQEVLSVKELLKELYGE